MPTRVLAQRKWLIALGAVVAFLIAPAIFGAGVYFGVHRGLDVINAAATVSPNSAYEAVADKEVSVFRPDTARACTVTGPSGPVTLQPRAGESLTITRSDQKYVLDGRFTPPTAASYTLDCGGPALVLDTRDEDRIAGGIVKPVVIGLIASFVVGMAGLAVLVLGVVSAVRARRA